jgi:hypothetical protein
LAIANLGGTVSILLGNGLGNYTPLLPHINVGGSPRSVAVGDFNNDQNLDLAVANGGNGAFILFGAGNGSFPTSTSINVGGTTIEAVAVGFFNNDQNLDLALGDAGGSTVTIVFGDGDGTFDGIPQDPLTAGNNPQFIAVGDFNEDQNFDLAVANAGSDTVSIFINNGMGSFVEPPTTTLNVGNEPFWIAVADFNDDSNLDLAVANFNGGGNSFVSIFLGDGMGSFTAAPNVIAGLGPVGQIQKQNDSKNIQTTCKTLPFFYFFIFLFYSYLYYKFS